jgi:hypothetical protein
MMAIPLILGHFVRYDRGMRGVIRSRNGWRGVIRNMHRWRGVR